MTKEVEFLIEICKSAAALITDDFETTVKGDNDELVTTLDTAVEQFLIDAIKKEYPQCDIVSEEYNPTAQLTKNCFVIDPIDGTSNFAAGLPLWGIQVAYIENGKTCAAVIFLPKLNEMYHADKSGAYCNGKKIRVSDRPAGKCFYSMSVCGKNASWDGSIDLKGFRYLRRIGSSSVSLAWIASAHYGGYATTYDTPWDYIPGYYIVEQAGGFTHDEPGCHVAANTKEFLDVLVKEIKGMK